MLQIFPKNFLWGAATAAHQVEGWNHNDWTGWEKTTGHEESGRACDHYNRFREDFDIAKRLGHNAHRFSIEWSRIEPEEGKFNEKEIAHYQDVIDDLRERGIEPFVTLWHWTLPIWVTKQGGWENKKTIDDFAQYVNKIVRSVKNVKFWITINEPEIYTMNSYLRGKWPPASPVGRPQKKLFFKFLKVYRNLAEAHKKVYTIIHSTWVSDTQVGITKNNSYFEGWPAPILNYVWNNWFLNKIRHHQDFIGLNYYFHNRIKGFKLNQNENKEISDMGWEIYPEGIYHVLKDLKKYNKPVYITENGVADARDVHREKFIKEHLIWVHKAISEGADVRGYFYWSLLDNFEWDKGFWPRFGLVEMDYQTMERKIKQSAMAYAKIAKENSLTT
ncbi:hypothetical protein A3C77_02640 [Candidatus Giovannonibacteria bacterium RIFCSPHIGHO2_02_FULL_45_13]|uniref:Beta-glucosidase n=1 Tax=Candidatus Giovannonibacteria bacterium RIFCSPHIGHO2_01_FULL_45_23 TaxID=1798325 RepID=A0A1F5VHB6_9BACT|nr:MAG: hypothetical protein A2834_00140 [Candidatus Giovannonibacteria bacterium RIFCSPHIGHO2_01_FULL_45_23]OGF75551.1 MAG: hypothetical protein A3C77_02640 [Candidatus Giovannonibacteria bacterium RIFCSPHIGHO2_02_FULL_45_13]